MAYIVEIAKRLKKKTDYEEEQFQEKKRWKPEVLPKGYYVVPKFEPLKSRDKRSIEELRKILTFIREKAQFVRKKNECTLMPIPVTSDAIIRHWSNGSRGIRKMEDIGLIRLHRHETKDRAKRYQYFYDVERQFIDYCKKNDIKPIPLVNYNPPKEKNVSRLIPASYKKKAVLTSSTRLYVPAGMSLNEFKEEIFKLVHMNYPELAEIERLADEINEKYYKEKPEFAIRCELKVKWNSRYKKDGSPNKRCITKIKFRATNSYCSLEESERNTLLKSLGYELHSDVNCSVPRINLSMNQGRWFCMGPNEYFDVDLYQLIFQEMYPNETFSPDDRKALKKLLLRTYFEKTPENLKKHIWRKLDPNGLDKDRVNSELVNLDRAVRKVVGPLMLGTNVYYVEACVYLRTLKSLLDMGYKVWLVYDGFYSDGVMMIDLFDALVKGCIEDDFNSFYKRYIDDLNAGKCVKLLG